VATTRAIHRSRAAVSRFFRSSEAVARVIQDDDQAASYLLGLPAAVRTDVAEHWMQSSGSRSLVRAAMRVLSNAVDDEAEPGPVSSRKRAMSPLASKTSHMTSTVRIDGSCPPPPPARPRPPSRASGDQPEPSSQVRKRPRRMSQVKGADAAKLAGLK